MSKIPPHHIESEMSLLGAVLLGGSKVLALVTGIVPDGSYFYREANGRIYDAMIDVSKSQPIDIVTLSEQLTATQVIDLVGGIAYLMQLGDFVPTTSHAAAYAKIIREHSNRRRVIEVSMDAIDKAYKLDSDPQTIVDDISSSLTGDISSTDTLDAIHIDESIESVIEEIESRDANHKMSGIATGWNSLDTMTGGWRKGELIVVGARPSMGKSAFALALSRRAAGSGNKMLFISVEMSMDMTTQRLLALETGIDLRRISNAALTSDEIYRLRCGRADLYDLPLYISAKNPMTVNDVRSVAVRMNAKHGLDMVVIDYLQMIETKGVNRVNEIGAISRALKGMARELNIPVMVLSSLNRKSDTRDDKRPVMSDLRESGDIESDADIALFLYRPSYYMSGDPPPIDEVEIIIRKNRNGPIGTASLEYNPSIGRFADLSYGGL
jgi:replicative DNA helicase